MSKFKVGDRVVFKQEGWRGRIVEIKDDGIHVVMFDDGSGDWFREDQLARNSALHSANPVVQNALNRKVGNAKTANVVSIEIKRKRSGVKTVVPIDEFKKSTQYGRDLTGYERFMLGRGIDKMETDEHRYSVVVTNATDSKALNASRSDAVLADYKKFVKAQMSAAITALETAKRDISAQTEVSARTAKATHANDEHEIVRDYGTKTAMAIGEAVSKLKAAKDNPLIL